MTGIYSCDHQSRVLLHFLPLSLDSWGGINLPEEVRLLNVEFRFFAAILH